MLKLQLHLEFLTCGVLDNICFVASNKKYKWGHLGFPGGAVVKNPPANAGDTGSSPGPERSHMLWSN